jgi:hypothetical protein
MTVLRWPTEFIDRFKLLLAVYLHEAKFELRSLKSCSSARSCYTWATRSEYLLNAPS